MATFRINEGYNKHYQAGRTYLPGQTIELSKYDPAWHGKFEPCDDQARELKRCALTIGRKIRVEDLSFARLEAAAADRSAMRDSALADQRAQPEELRDPSPAAMQPPPEPTTEPLRGTPDVPARRGPGRPPKSPPPSPPFRGHVAKDSWRR